MIENYSLTLSFVLEDLEIDSQFFFLAESVSMFSAQKACSSLWAQQTKHSDSKDSWHLETKMKYSCLLHNAVKEFGMC